MAEFQAHQQLILRLPDALAEAVRGEMALDGEMEAIEVKPQGTHEDKDISPYFFQFRYREHWYPALLVNMPCNLETHKTFDNTTYYKCGDIGQMLHVFSTDAEREAEFTSLQTEAPEGYAYVLPSGLTPPTKNIIKRKFTRTTEYKPPERELVSSVVAEMAAMNPGSTIEETIEEVVDFEDWMVSEDQPDGITVSVRFNAPGSAAAQAGPLALGGGVVSILGGMNLASERILLEHPELIFSKKEFEEIRTLLDKKNQTEAQTNSDISDHGTRTIAPLTSSSANVASSNNTTPGSAVSASSHQPLPSPSASKKVLPRITVHVGGDRGNKGSGSDMIATPKVQDLKASQGLEPENAGNFDMGADALLEDDGGEEEIEGGVVEGGKPSTGLNEDNYPGEKGDHDEGEEMEIDGDDDETGAKDDDDDEVDEAWAKDFEDDLMNEL